MRMKCQVYTHTQKGQERKIVTNNIVDFNMTNNIVDDYLFGVKS